MEKSAASVESSLAPISTIRRGDARRIASRLSYDLFALNVGRVFRKNVKSDYRTQKHIIFQLNLRTPNEANRHRDRG